MLKREKNKDKNKKIKIKKRKKRRKKEKTKGRRDIIDGGLGSNVRQFYVGVHYGKAIANSIFDVPIIYSLTTP